MRLRQIVPLLTLLVALSAAPASAQWFVSPNAGASFGGDTPEDSKLNFGASAGYLSDNFFGFEVDFGFSPDFFTIDNDDIDFNSNVSTFMVNAMTVAPSHMAVRPYGVGGIGIMRSNIDDAEDLFDVTNNDFGFNVGGGLIGHFNDNVGWRGDIRYFRALVDNQEDLEFDVAVGDFNFWRGTFGVTFMWGR